MSEQKLRCWPGCVAEVVGGEVPENIGRRFLVTERATKTEEVFYERGLASWLAKPLQPVVLADQDGKRIIDDCRIGIVPDCYLRPIEPLDEPEAITEDVPQEVEA